MAERHFGHEETDIPAQRIGYWIAATLLLIAIALVGVRTLNDSLGPRPTPGKPLPAPPIQLQADPSAELRVLREQKRAILNGYGWVDREKGIAHIPLNRAMDLLAKKAGSSP